jgi:threonine dehydrogenase-like Zn-dependent dehydrogenase
VFSLFAGQYIDGFMDYWKAALSKQSGFTMVVIGCGIIGVLIIVSGRKKLD